MLLLAKATIETEKYLAQVLVGQRIPVKTSEFVVGQTVSDATCFADGDYVGANLVQNVLGIFGSKLFDSLLLERE
jgi:hypothetical protein